MTRGHNIPALQATNITVDFTKHWPLRFRAWLPTQELGQVVDKFIRDLKIQDGSKDDGRQEVDFPNNTCALEIFSVYMDCFHCTESTRVIGYGYFFSFSSYFSDFIVSCVSKYSDAVSLLYNYFFLTLHWHGILKDTKEYVRSK